MTDVARTRFQALVEQWRIQSDGTLDLERGRLLNRCADELSALLVQEAPPESGPASQPLPFDEWASYIVKTSEHKSPHQTEWEITERLNEAYGLGRIADGDRCSRHPDADHEFVCMVCVNEQDIENVNGVGEL